VHKSALHYHKADSKAHRQTDRFDVGRNHQGNQVSHPKASKTYGKRYLGTGVAGYTSCGKAQSLSRHIKGGIVSALEEGHNGVTIALAPAETAGDRTGNVSEAAVVILIENTQ
jgi:hypothetical protein